MYHLHLIFYNLNCTLYLLKKIEFSSFVNTVIHLCQSTHSQLIGSLSAIVNLIIKLYIMKTRVVLVE